ncbi:uncharacterized protein LOC130891853 [Diorhabda carinulata]|uniref:uncharacterized protein LOC130891853 n=1 Tax=Diorhabda carinulata TaxID=1163345 RepID=UPI0025A12CCD|nr:uncharacterized protein LOC130891853 [Diorhabda carinulata]
METHIENNLKNLNQKFQNEDVSFDSVDMEKCLREFKTELYVKRDQVKQLRSDLEMATEEIVELKKALDVATKGLDEKNFNLNIITKKFRITEDELLKKIDSLNTIQMQHNLMV